MALPCTVYSAAISPINYRSLHIPYIGLVLQPIIMPTRKIFLQLSLTPTCSSLFLYHTCKIPIPLFPNHTTSTLLNCNLRNIYQFPILSHTTGTLLNCIPSFLSHMTSILLNSMILFSDPSSNTTLNCSLNPSLVDLLFLIPLSLISHHIYRRQQQYTRYTHMSYPIEVPM
jgi:hypothetical protein